MQRFAPPTIPQSAPKELKDYGQQLHAAVRKASESANDFLSLKVLHAEPAKYFAGMVIYADGSDFNPGSGEGIYRRKADNSGWSFVG
jgi:hypothetical protein